MPEKPRMTNVNVVNARPGNGGVSFNALEVGDFFTTGPGDNFNALCLKVERDAYFDVIGRQRWCETSGLGAVYPIAKIEIRYERVK